MRIVDRIQVHSFKLQQNILMERLFLLLDENAASGHSHHHTRVCRVISGMQHGRKSRRQKHEQNVYHCSRGCRTPRERYPCVSPLQTTGKAGSSRCTATTREEIARVTDTNRHHSTSRRSYPP